VTLRRVLVAQGAYYLATGVAPFVSRRGFERVTGPKLEWWLVQTVSVLVGAIGAALLAAVRNRRETPELTAMAAGCAAGLATIDVVHVARRRIAPTYLVDAAAQLALLAGLVRRGPSSAGPARDGAPSSAAKAAPARR
jgi:hypothetical protein